MPSSLLSTSARRSRAAWKLAGFCVPAVASRMTPSVSGATRRASLTGRTGGRVDEDQRLAAPQRLEHARQADVEHLGRVRRHRAAGDHPEAVAGRLSSGLRPSASVVESPVAVVEPEDLVLARAPQVGVEHDRLDPDAAEGDREVGHDGRLALPGLGARDLDHARGLVHQELEVGAQRAVALLQVVEPLLVPDQRGAAARERALARRSRPSTGASVCCATSAAVSMRRRNCSSASASRMPPNRPSTAGDAEQQRRARLDRGELRRRRVDERRDHQLVVRRSSLERLGGRRRRGRGVARVGVRAR